MDQASLVMSSRIRFPTDSEAFLVLMARCVQSQSAQLIRPAAFEDISAHPLISLYCLTDRVAQLLHFLCSPGFT